MKFRNMIFVLAIAFSAIFAAMIGTSYAYYVATGGTSIDVTTGNIGPGVSVVFEQNKYINMNTGVPISEDDIGKYANESRFTLYPNRDVLGDSEYVINIGISDISIDEELRVEDFKYKCLCSYAVDGEGTLPIRFFAFDVTGDGTDFTDDVLSSGYFELGTMTTTNANHYGCIIEMWLQESGENQNHLMNKKFSGLIKVNTLFKK